MNKIITIARQFGSGGRELGRRLAEELGIDYFDKEIITQIAEHTSLSEEYVQQVVEHTPHSLFPITIGQSLSFVSDYQFQLAQSVYHAQSDIIRSLAEKSDCVIVGRCADYILREQKPLRIFVYADMDSRIKRCMERNSDADMTEKEMRKQIQQLDKNRARYYDYYTGLRWGEKENYDLCINTANADIKKMSKLLAGTVGES